MEVNNWTQLSNMGIALAVLIGMFTDLKEFILSFS